MGKVHTYSPSEFLDEIKQVPPQYLPQLFQIVHLYKEYSGKRLFRTMSIQQWCDIILT